MMFTKKSIDHSVDLSKNRLNKMHIDKLIYLAKKLSPDLVKLKLSDNLLGSFFDQHLIDLFQELPKNLKYLYLSDNDLFNSRDDESAANIFNALPDSLIYLDVTDNDCWDPEVEIEERMVGIYPLLKPSIQKAINYLHEKPNFVAHKLDHMIFGKRQNDIKIRASQLPFKISESLLQKLVHLLEKTEDCSSLFIAGLLLEGRIPSQISSDFSASELRNYCLKRMNDALTLYMNMSSGYSMNESSAKKLAINCLIAQRTASVIRPCLLAQTPANSKKEPSSDSNRSFNP